MHYAMCFDQRAAHARRVGLGMGGAGGIKVAVNWIVKRPNNPLCVGEWSYLLNLCRTNKFSIHAHKPVLCALC